MTYSSWKRKVVNMPLQPENKAMREKLLSMYEVEKKEDAMYIKMVGADINECFRLSDLLEQTGLKFKGYWTTSYGYQLLMSLN